MRNLYRKAVNETETLKRDAAGNLHVTIAIHLPVASSECDLIGVSSAVPCSELPIYVNKLSESLVRYMEFSYS